MKSLAWVALAGLVALGGCSSTQKVEQVPAGPTPSRAAFGDSAIPAGSTATPGYGAAYSSGTPTATGSTVFPGTPGMGATDPGTGPVAVAPVAPDKATKVAAAPKTAKAGKTAVASSAKGGSSYVVKKGDTLTGIAKSVYGNANDWKKIAKANKITDPNMIVVGQTLKLPA